MCGIVAVINLSSSPRTEISAFLNDAAIVGALRGTDSIGIAQIAADRSTVRIEKSLTTPKEFLELQDVATAISEADVAYVTILHHRAATVGAVTSDAAQPFHYVYGPTDDRWNLVLAHNGTLTNHKLDATETPLATDSEWLTLQVAKSTYDGRDGCLDVAATLEKIKGAYSIVAASNNHAYLANNGKRPMFVALSQDRKVLYCASEAGMLDWLLERNSIKTDGTIIEMDPYKCYTISFDNKQIEIEAKSIVTDKMYDDDDDSWDWTNYRNKSYQGYYKSAYSTPKESLDSWYKKLTGSDPEPVVFTTPGKSDSTALVPISAAKPETTCSYSAGVSNADAILAGRAIQLMRGKPVSMMFDEYDANIKEAYGMCWQSSTQTQGVDAALLDFINRCGAVVRGMSRVDISKMEEYEGKITGFRWVPEMRNGAMTIEPYFVIDPLSVSKVSSVTAH